MADADHQWEVRIADLWANIDAYDEDDFAQRIDALVAELPPGSATGLFERGAAADSTGHADRAVPLYTAALDAGLAGERRRRAVIQMASSLRNLGNPQQAVALLTAEAEAASDHLDGAVATFLALALVDVGREREAVAVALSALSTHLPRYNRSAARYARELTRGPTAPPDRALAPEVEATGVPQMDGGAPEPRGARSSALPSVALIGGTGRLGPALAARFAQAGHTVTIGSRDVSRAEQAAVSVTRAIAGAGGGRVGGADNLAAAAAAEVVVITVPFEAQEATLRGLADAVAERVVVSTAVPVRFARGAGPVHVDVEQGSASEQVAALLPRARVVGALHTVSSATLAKLDREVGADVLITGDDPTAKAVVAELLASLAGARVIDAGSLRNSRYVEQLTVLLLTINLRVRRNTGLRITNLPDELALVERRTVVSR